MKNLKLTLILTILCLVPSAFAGMSGTYEVLKTECDDFIFSQSKTAVVVADEANFKVGFLSNYSSPDGSMRLITAFDYKVGSRKSDCRLDECQDTVISGYSKDKNQFVHLFLQSETHTSTPILQKQVVFSLVERELSIVVDGKKECLFKELSK